MTHVGSPASDNTAAMIANTREHLKRVDRQDWWRWITVVFITLLLTAGVFALSLPALQRDVEEQRELNIGVTSLLAVVLLFDVFAVYQQVVITRLRRDLTKQIAMSATLELLRPPDAQVVEGRSRRRKFPRFHFDQRVSVSYTADGKERRVYGRTSDLSEGGLGAVIPESLAIGAEIAVEVALGVPDKKLSAAAVVRHRRGFHHCIELLNLTPEQVQQIRAACAAATPAMDFFEYRDAASAR